MLLDTLSQDTSTRFVLCEETSILRIEGAFVGSYPSLPIDKTQWENYDGPKSVCFHI
jgi:hypothetical protein